MTNADPPKPAALLDLAYLYEPTWRYSAGDWVKSLLLFFDGIALLVPDYMYDQPLLTDPVLAQPLDDQGLLHRLSPESLIDEVTSDSLTDLLDGLIEQGAFDDLDPRTAFVELSYSRLGGHAQGNLTDIVLEQLRERGLARPTEDGVSIPLHPVVRAFVLVVLPQLLRAPAEAAGYALQPVTEAPRTLQALRDTLNLGELPTAGHVVAADLQKVALDLSSIPLDEVLGFRADHGAEYRRYARDLRLFVRDLAPLQPLEREQALRDRQEALADSAEELRVKARKAWNRPLAAFGLGITGSAVSVAAGNPIGAAVAAAGALLGLRREADPATVYSYLFKVRDNLSA
jgi:hypothetical protein